MKAVVKYLGGKGNVELRDVPEPTPGPGQVKVEVKAAGVCGSDLHIYHDDIKINIVPPVVMGHEFAGVIVEIGRASSTIRLATGSPAKPPPNLAVSVSIAGPGITTCAPSARWWATPLTAALPATVW